MDIIKRYWDNSQTICIVSLTTVTLVSWQFGALSVCAVFFSTVLERKMSMRRPRQELIEQGVLKELPENGMRFSACCILCAFK